MARAASPVRDRRRPALLERLLEATEGLLEAGETFSELSVERLATAADMPRSTFYLYWADKGELLEELARDIVLELMRPVREWLALPPDATYGDVLATQVRLAETYAEHGALMRAVVDSASFRSLVEQAGDEIAAHIRAGQRGGWVRAGFKPAAVAPWVVWMAERGLYQLVADADRRRRRELADGLATIIWSTLYEGTR